MYREASLFFGILGTILSLVMGCYSIVTWDTVTVLVAVFIGIPSLILGYEKMKPKDKTTDLRKVKDERARIKPHDWAREEIENELESESPRESEAKCMLLPDKTNITKLAISNDLLDQIYESARRLATHTYRYTDAELSQFFLQVYPYGIRADMPSALVNIYMDFYSKIADKKCRFKFGGDTQQIKHLSPDKFVRYDSDRKVFGTLPWNESPLWMKFLDIVYIRKGPLPKAQTTYYHLSAFINQENKLSWRISFTDDSSGRDFRAVWDGTKLDEENIRFLD